MLSLAIIPGVSVGPFHLGMPLNATIAKLEEQYGSIKDINVLYSDENPLGTDIVLDLTQDGIQLRFNPQSQRLQLIEIYDPSKLQLTYNDSLFSKPDEIATFQETYTEFGPSRGKYDVVHKKYQLSYPGLALFFAIDAKHDPLFAQGAVDLTVDPTLDGYHPCLSNICVFGGSLEKTEPPSLRETLEHYPLAANYMERVEVQFGLGIHFAEQNVQILFGDTCQDVITKIGPPSDQYYKTNDKMRIHAAQHVTGTPSADFFYNYFHLGVDLLFDAHSSRVKKFVLHTNYPGHFDFYRYNRCNFLVKLDPAHLRALSPITNGELGEAIHPAAMPSSASTTATVPSASAAANATATAITTSTPAASTGGGKKKSKNKNTANAAGDSSASGGGSSSSRNDDLAGLLMPSVVSQQPSALPMESMELQEVPLLETQSPSPRPAASLAVTALTKWSDVQQELGALCGKPVAFNRAPAANSSNPFGATLFWGVQDMVVEVMANMHIASVVLFQPPTA